MVDDWYMIVPCYYHPRCVHWLLMSCWIIGVYFFEYTLPAERAVQFVTGVGLLSCCWLIVGGLCLLTCLFVHFFRGSLPILFPRSLLMYYLLVVVCVVCMHALVSPAVVGRGSNLFMLEHAA
jgi:hypothetical protein